MNTGPMGMMGGYNLNFSFDQTAVKSLFILLQNTINPQTKPLNSSQLIDAIKLSDEVRSHLPSPVPIRINQQLMSPEQTLLSMRHSFSTDSDYLQVTYSSQLPGGQNLGNHEDRVLVASLSASGQNTTLEFDRLVRDWGDISCKDALYRLTKPQ
jgi:hypothetical protein